jgi:hypothetical protein
MAPHLIAEIELATRRGKELAAASVADGGVSR